MPSTTLRQLTTTAVATFSFGSSSGLVLGPVILQAQPQLSAWTAPCTGCGSGSGVGISKDALSTMLGRSLEPVLNPRPKVEAESKSRIRGSCRYRSQFMQAAERVSEIGKAPRSHRAQQALPPVAGNQRGLRSPKDSAAIKLLRPPATPSSWLRYGKGVSLRVEHVIVQGDQTGVAEDEVQILERLGEPEALHRVLLRRGLQQHAR